MLRRYLGLEPGATFGSAMARYRGIGPGFDVLRILLALAIFYGHTKWAAGESGMAMPRVLDEAAGQGVQALDEWLGATRPLKLALVPMFFALSGYLVTGSAMRIRATSTFLAHRALRIFPALAVEVALSALVLGPTLTTAPLADYFTSPLLFRYFGNVVGHVFFRLPGLFENNPVPYVVNTGLWTLPAEFYCYLITAALMAIGLIYNKRVYTILALIGFAGLMIAHALTGLSTPHGPFPTHMIVLYFLAGVLFYHWQDRIPANPWLCLAAIPFAYLLLISEKTIYLAVPAIVYGTLFFGLIPIPKIKILASGDYSYGVYLYGFPIAQSLVAIFPNLFIRHFPSLFVAAFLCTIGFAALSWHVIEKHALKQKRRLPERWFSTKRHEKAFLETAPVITGRSQH